MSRSKNFVTLTLMMSSIILLLVLQAFWLRGAYKDAEDDFRKETNSLFRNTIFAMHDSLIQRSIEQVDGADPVIRRRIGPRKVFLNDTTLINPNLPDSLLNYVKITDRTARVQIYTSTTKPDSLQMLLRPLVTKFRTDKEPKTFIFRFGPDSLKVDSIHYFFKEALAKAGVNATFKVVNFKIKPGEQIERRVALSNPTFTSEIVPFNPGVHYAVSFSGIEGLLVREITPQILFSVFLSVLTILSFYLMYRNLRSQQKLMQIKNDFISNVTHELKTPVATVSVALEALKNFNALGNPQRTSEYLEIAQNELNRLTLMTDKILKTAVYEDQGVELKIERIDSDTLIQEVLSSMKLVFEKRNIKLRYHKEGNDFTLDGSRAHLTNVLYNLLDNALKYSSENASVDVMLQTTVDKLVLSIKDNGIGISQEYQKKIFEKFFRVPSGDVHNTKGYGLGLSYVASVVKSHNGKIILESEPGKGSNFIIELNTSLLPAR